MRVLVVILAAIFGFMVGEVYVALTPSVASSSSAEAYTRLASSTFRIFSPVALNYGTAFVVEHDKKPYLVTNRHVCGTETIFFVDQGPTRLGRHFVATVEALSAEADVCLLSPDDSFEVERHKPLQIRNELVDVLDTVFTLGYPKAIGPAGSSGYVEAIELMRAKEIEGESDRPTFQYMVRTSFGVRGGQSGSPVVDKRGQVVGIVTLQYLTSLNNGGFTPSYFITRLFKYLPKEEGK